MIIALVIYIYIYYLSKNSCFLCLIIEMVLVIFNIFNRLYNNIIFFHYLLMLPTRANSIIYCKYIFLCILLIKILQTMQIYDKTLL